MPLRRHRGVALMMVLLFTAMIMVLGISFLEMVERDNQFQANQELSAEAYYMARAGLNYYLLRGERFAMNVTQTQTLAPQEQFAVILYSSGDVVSVGTVYDTSGNVRAQRTLLVPGGNFPFVQDVTR